MGEISGSHFSSFKRLCSHWAIRFVWSIFLYDYIAVKGPVPLCRDVLRMSATTIQLVRWTDLRCFVIPVNPMNYMLKRVRSKVALHYEKASVNFRILKSWCPTHRQTASASERVVQSSYLGVWAGESRKSTSFPISMKEMATMAITPRNRQSSFLKKLIDSHKIQYRENN